MPERELTTEADIRRVLGESRTVAVLGAHPDAARPANFVPAYLHQAGYRVLPVNAAHVGQEWWSEPVRGSLADIGQPVDVVDIFRRADKLGEHLADILAMSPRPRVVWLQQGIRNDEFARQLLEQGIAVVQDRCMMTDHQRLFGG